MTDLGAIRKRRDGGGTGGPSIRGHEFVFETGAMGVMLPRGTVPLRLSTTALHIQLRFSYRNARPCSHVRLLLSFGWAVMD